MGMPKPSSTLLLLLLIVTVSASQKQVTSEARTLLSQKQKYSKIFSTLGVVCKCCEETGAEGLSFVGRNVRDKGLTDSGKGLEEQSPVVWWQKRSTACLEPVDT
ncbi:hypothetical protein D5086_012570 [Populus alba]|uniref:Uncharacterized protein n=1 Tax=Populus alba TaxID=43335 RepID=A0ACC4C328_POPAL